MQARKELDLEHHIRHIVAAQLIAVGLAGCGCPALPDDFDSTAQVSLSAEDCLGTTDTTSCSEQSCRAACTGTEPYQAALDAGFFDSEIETSCQGNGELATCTVTTDCSAGRRPVGLRPLEVHDSGIGGWWARMAALEAASVHAFEALADDLVRLGAPASLPSAARAAARDEQRHASLCQAMTQRYGAQVPEVRIGPRPVPDLLELALDNVSEGCVREAFAALLARWQARTATDHRTRRILSQIASDETRHGQLSIGIDSWARRLLPPQALPALDEARDRALSALRGELLQSEACPALGLPDLSVRMSLLDAFAAAIG